MARSAQVGSCCFRSEDWACGRTRRRRSYNPRYCRRHPKREAVIDERSAKYLDTLIPEVKQAFTDFVLEAKQLLHEEGLDYRVICGTRSWEAQEALYAKGRTAPGPKVTNAKPGSSMHNFGLAISRESLPRWRQPGRATSCRPDAQVMRRTCTEAQPQMGWNFQIFL
jgi:hypothetical protein